MRMGSGLPTRLRHSIPEARHQAAHLGAGVLTRGTGGTDNRACSPASTCQHWQLAQHMATKQESQRVTTCYRERSALPEFPTCSSLVAALPQGDARRGGGWHALLPCAQGTLLCVPAGSATPSFQHRLDDLCRVFGGVRLEVVHVGLPNRVGDASESGYASQYRPQMPGRPRRKCVQSTHMSRRSLVKMMAPHRLLCRRRR